MHGPHQCLELFLTHSEFSPRPRFKENFAFFGVWIVPGFFHNELSVWSNDFMSENVLQIAGFAWYTLRVCHSGPLNPKNVGHSRDLGKSLPHRSRSLLSLCIFVCETGSRAEAVFCDDSPALNIEPIREVSICRLLRGRGVSVRRLFGQPLVESYSERQSPGGRRRLTRSFHRQLANLRVCRAIL